MTTKITSADAVEYQPHRWVTFASDLGWAPGRWPNGLTTDLGNGQDFRLIRIDEDGAAYQQLLGCITLKVFND